MKIPPSKRKDAKFKIGDKVVRKPSVNEWDVIDGLTIYATMYAQTEDEYSGKLVVGEISRVVNEEGEKPIYRVEFPGYGTVFSWPEGALDLYESNEQSETQPKEERPKKKKAKERESKANHRGYTPKSEFLLYDYLNRPVAYRESKLRNITKIEVTVMSGDETGCFYGVLNGEPWKFAFDANTAGNRFTSYDDGSYTVEGKENIEKWITWSYDREKAIYAEYSMERMRAFKR